MEFGIVITLRSLVSVSYLTVSQLCCLCASGMAVDEVCVLSAVFPVTGRAVCSCHWTDAGERGRSTSCGGNRAPAGEQRHDLRGLSAGGSVIHVVRRGVGFAHEGAFAVPCGVPACFEGPTLSLRGGPSEDACVKGRAPQRRGGP